MRRTLLISSLILIALAVILSLQIGCAARTPNDCLIDALRYQKELPGKTWNKILYITYTQSGYEKGHYILAFDVGGKVYLQDSEGSTSTGYPVIEATAINMAQMYVLIRKWSDTSKLTSAAFVGEEGF